MNEAVSAGEAAIRRYLDYLADPSSVVDSGKVAALEAELAATTDLVKRLHLFGAIDKAKRADGESVRSAFVQHAKAYAAANDLPVSSFRAVGVSDIALAEAGFDLGHGVKRGPTRSIAPTVRKRAPKVSQASIRSHILSVKGSFTLNDIIGDAGGSLGTVNAVVKELIAEGKVVSNGPDANHHGRGRAPIRYSAKG